MTLQNEQTDHENIRLKNELSLLRQKLDLSEEKLKLMEKKCDFAERISSSISQKLDTLLDNFIAIERCLDQKINHSQRLIGKIIYNPVASSEPTDDGLAAWTEKWRETEEKVEKLKRQLDALDEHKVLLESQADGQNKTINSKPSEQDGANDGGSSLKVMSNTASAIQPVVRSDSLPLSNRVTSTTKSDSSSNQANFSIFKFQVPSTFSFSPTPPKVSSPSQDLPLKVRSSKQQEALVSSDLHSNAAGLCKPMEPIKVPTFANFSPLKSSSASPTSIKSSNRVKENNLDQANPIST